MKQKHDRNLPGIDKVKLQVLRRDDDSGELRCVLMVEEVEHNHVLAKTEPGAERLLYEVASFLACCSVSGGRGAESIVDDAVGTGVAMFMQHVSDDQRAAANYLRSFAQKMEEQQDCIDIEEGLKRAH